MYRIGIFADKTGLSPKALRLYEQKGLLLPRRDEDNQYRYYIEADLQRAARLLAFRQLGFSLEQLAAILKAFELPDARAELIGLLTRRLDETGLRLAEFEAQREGLQTMLALLREGGEVSQELLSRLRPMSANTRRDLMQTIESFSITGPRSQNEDLTLIHAQGEDALYLVADGFGGVWASQEAARWLQARLDFAALTPAGHAAYLEQLMQDLNRHLYASRPEPAGTCVSLLALRARQAYIAHVGDTRIYRWHEGLLSRLTEDHSLISRMLAAGEILQKDVAAHPDRKQLYAALGHAPELADLCLASEPLRPGSVYLLASDGITGTLSDEELRRELLAQPLPAAIARIKALAARHSDDNSSLIAVPIEG